MENNLLDEVSSYIGQYVATSDENRLILSAWVIHSWSFDFDVPKSTPYLNVVSSERSCGKTTTLDVLETIVRNPFKAVSMTPATLFRSIEQFNRPTMMIDEVDTIWSRGKVANKELSGVVNAGYREGASVPRVSGGEVKKFNVFSPKVLSGITDASAVLPDTVASRCIPIVLRRKAPGAEVAPFFASEASEAVEPILDRVETWLGDHADALREYGIRPIAGLDDRQSEIVSPLVAIAIEFGKGYEMIAAVKKAYADFARLKDATLTKLLTDIAELFAIEGPRVHTDDVIAYVGLKDGKELATALEPFGIASMPVRKANLVYRGFKLEQFEETFELYDVKVGE